MWPWQYKDWKSFSSHQWRPISWYIFFSQSRQYSTQSTLSLLPYSGVGSALRRDQEMQLVEKIHIFHLRYHTNQVARVKLFLGLLMKSVTYDMMIKSMIQTIKNICNHPGKLYTIALVWKAHVKQCGNQRLFLLFDRNCLRLFIFHVQHCWQTFLQIPIVRLMHNHAVILDMPCIPKNLRIVSGICVLPKRCLDPLIITLGNKLNVHIPILRPDWNNQPSKWVQYESSTIQITTKLSQVFCVV